MTLFSTVYNRFLDRITDDMYVELTPQDTVRDIQRLLINAIPEFEFPRVDLMNYTIETQEIDLADLTDEDFLLYKITDDLDDTVEPTRGVIEHSYFNADLSQEEIYILAIIMVTGWLQRQISSIEVTRMKYSGADFKMTSQANHLSKLLITLTECQRQSFHL